MNPLFLGYGKDGRQRIYADKNIRSRHMHVIGATGTGKSKFLEWMIRGDIRAGHGLCLIDPHGDLYEQILRWCAYENFLSPREIILLNPSQKDFVTAFNPFAQGQGEIDTQVSRRIQVTMKAWGQDKPDQTPRLETWLRNIFWVLVEKGLSIVEAGYFLKYADPSATRVIERLSQGISNSSVADEWNLAIRQLNEAHHKGRTPRDYKEQTESTFNRLHRLLSSPNLMNMMGQLENNLDLAKIMETGKILLVNLKPSDRLDDVNARLLGSLLVNQFYEVARRREKTHDAPFPRPFYFYIDEFQNFATHDMNKILAEGRKMGLHLILSHQNLSQVEKEMDLDGLITNTRTKVVFGGLNYKDATRMVEEIFTSQIDLQELKEAVTQTKFWPVYGRDQVRTISRTKTHTTGTGSGHTSASSHADALTTGTSQTAPSELFGSPNPMTLSNSRTSIAGHSEASSFSENESLGESEGESVADIPIYRYEAFEEATQTYTIEEQKHRMAADLKEQWTRHCFIKVMDGKTEPMLVPKVKEPDLFESTLQDYQRKLFERSAYSLPTVEARRRIEQRQQKLLEAAKPPSPEPEDNDWGVDPEK